MFVHGTADVFVHEHVKKPQANKAPF